MSCLVTTRVFPPEGWVADAAFVSPDSKAWIVAARKGQLWMQAIVDAGEATKVSFHTVYFPGWTAYIDGHKTELQASSWTEYEEGRRAALGVVQVPVEEGRHLVTIVFEDTAVRRWAEIASAASILVLGGLLLIGAACRLRVAPKSKPLAIRLAVVVALGVLIGSFLYSVILTPNTPEWTVNDTVLDLVKQAENRSLEIAAPEGATPDDYVHPRSFTIAGDSREVLFMHPPSSASVTLWVPDGASLEFAIGLDQTVWDKPGSGAEFQIEVRDGANVVPVFSSYVNPKADPTQRRWIEHRVDLDRFSHRQVELVLRTLPGDSVEYAWAGWGRPRVTLRHP